MDFLTSIFGQLLRWPVPVAIAFCSIAIGIILKKAQFFPNRFIPMVIVPMNALAYWYTGDPGTIPPEIHHPGLILFVYGIILGFFAWGAHAFVLKKLALLLPAGVMAGFDTESYTKEKGKNETDTTPKTPSP